MFSFHRGPRGISSGSMKGGARPHGPIRNERRESTLGESLLRRLSGTVRDTKSKDCHAFLMASHGVKGTKSDELLQTFRSKATSILNLTRTRTSVRLLVQSGRNHHPSGPPGRGRERTIGKASNSGLPRTSVPQRSLALLHTMEGYTGPISRAKIATGNVYVVCFHVISWALVDSLCECLA